MVNLKNNLFEGEIISVEVSLDYLFEKTIDLLREDLPKREETANYIVSNFKNNGNLSQLWSLTHNVSPSLPKFEIDGIVPL